MSAEGLLCKYRYYVFDVVTHIRPEQSRVTLMNSTTQISLTSRISRVPVDPLPPSRGAVVQQQVDSCMN